ncbi:MAG TPA: MFS transporter, partial [Acidobacteriota bacterium]|nr:MFS transporter [Acidobacteriota bacterium]
RLAPYCVPFFGAMLIVFAAVRSLAAALFASALVAVGMITQLFLTNTLLQSLVPDRLRGRVVSIYSVTFGGFAPLGSLVLGQVAHVLPLQTVVAAGGAAAAAIGLVLARPLSDAVRAAVEARVPGRAAEPEVR